MSFKIVSEWLHSCSGCEIAMLNMGEVFFKLLDMAEIIHMPILIDHKYFKDNSANGNMSIPKADIGIISGGIANEEHEKLLKKIRKSCKLLIALGTCATHGGIPALLNSWTRQEAMESIFTTSTTEKADMPNQDVPKFLDRVYALDEKIKIDILIPGCPPNPSHIAEILTSLIEDKPLKKPEKSVCDTCPTIRTGKTEVTFVKRFLENVDYDPNKPIDDMRCLLEQGFMCMGPVTAAGCSFGHEPSCIHARVPCRGCYGPVKKEGNQLIDMINALASKGIDWKGIVDRKSLLRFSGAHGLLRPIKTN